MFSRIMKKIKDIKNVNISLSKKSLLTGIIIAVLVVSCSAGGYIFLHKDVQIIVDGKTLKTETCALKVNSLLQEENITVKNGDIVKPSLNSFIKEDMTIKILRAVPVTVKYNNKTKTVNMVDPTVQKILQSQNITVERADIIKTNLMDEGLKEYYLNVIDVEYKEYKNKIPLDYNQKYVPEDEMLKGETKVVQEGEKGYKEQLQKVTYKNDKKVKSEILESKTIKEPVEEVIKFGTKTREEISARSLHQRHKFSYLSKMEVEATAYTHTGNRTCTGIWPSRGVVAVDPNVIPLGTEVYVEGYGFAEAQDTGGAINGRRIDVFMKNQEKALNWGRKNVELYILEVPH